MEPHQLLSAGHLWYLVAWDLRRSDRRTFRLDRLEEVRLAGKRFTPREIPGGDAAAFLTAAVDSLPRNVEAVVLVDAPHPLVAESLTRIDHVLVASDATTCTVRFRSHRLDSLVMDVARVGVHAAVSVLEPGRVREELDQLSRRITQR